MKDLEAYPIYARFVQQANVVWSDADSLSEEIEACYRSNPFLYEDLRDLTVCEYCLELHGRVRLDNKEIVKQKCRCSGIRDREWSRYDFDTKYETCYCCGLEVIPSGSKWSAFHCMDCKKRVITLNKKLGQCIVPFGRHSMMNSVALSSEEILNNAAVKLFVRRVNRINDKIDVLDSHRKKILARRLEYFKISKEAPIIELILRTNNLELQQMKEEAFLELLTLYTSMSVVDLKSFITELNGWRLN